jgi:hypothetical protein
MPTVLYDSVEESHRIPKGLTRVTNTSVRAAWGHARVSERTRRTPILGIGVRGGGGRGAVTPSKK